MKKYLCLIFLFMFFANRSFPQYGSIGSVDARSIGMAKTYNAVSSGVFSVGTNPANLASTENFLEFSTVLPLPGLSIKSGTDFMSIDEFNYFFGGVNGESRMLTEQDKKHLNDLFKDGGVVFADASINIFSASLNINKSVGAFAFSMNDFNGGKFIFPQAIVDLALNGNLQGRSYNLNDEDIKAWWVRNYSLSYARVIFESKEGEKKNLFDRIAAGISIKLVHGFFYVGTEKVNTSLQTSNTNEIRGNADLLAFTSFADGFNVNYDFESLSTEDGKENSKSFSPFMSPAGTGFGFDLGLSASIEDHWNFSLAVTDIGKINWTKNAAEFTASGNIYLNDITDDSQLDSLKDGIFGEGKSINEFSTGLPTALRLGASYNFFDDNDVIPGTLLLALDYNQGFNELPGNSTLPRFSIGAEWKPGNWIPYIRTGFSFGGYDEFNWAFGLGTDIGIVELHIATSDMHSFIAPNSAEHISIAIGSKWKF